MRAVLLLALVIAFPTAAAGLLAPTCDAGLTSMALPCQRETWSARVATPNGSYDSAVAAIVEARLVVAVSEAAHGDHAVVLRAFDLASGSPAWSAALPGWSGDLVAGGGSLVAASGGEVARFDAASGSRVWTADVAGTRALALDEASSIVLAAGEDDTTLTVVALDVATGLEAWRLDAPTTLTYAYLADVAPGYALASNYDGASVVAFDPATGAHRWTQHVAGHAGSTLALAHGRPVVGSSSGLAMLSPIDGSVAWSVAFPADSMGGLRGIVEIPGGVAATGYGPAGYETLAFDADSGAPMWSRAYAGLFGFCSYPTGIATDGESVFVTGYSFGPGAEDFVTLAYDAATGADLWSARLDGGRSDLFPAIAVSDGTLAIAGEMTAVEGNDLGIVAYRL